MLLMELLKAWAERRGFGGWGYRTGHGICNDHLTPFLPQQALGYSPEMPQSSTFLPSAHSHCHFTRARSAMCIKSLTVSVSSSITCDDGTMFPPLLGLLWQLITQRPIGLGSTLQTGPLHDKISHLGNVLLPIFSKNLHWAATSTACRPRRLCTLISRQKWLLGICFCACAAWKDSAIPVLGWVILGCQTWPVGHSLEAPGLGCCETLCQDQCWAFGYGFCTIDLGHSFLSSILAPGVPGWHLAVEGSFSFFQPQRVRDEELLVQLLKERGKRKGPPPAGLPS